MATKELKFDTSSEENESSEDNKSVSSEDNDFFLSKVNLSSEEDESEEDEEHKSYKSYLRRKREAETKSAKKTKDDSEAVGIDEDNENIKMLKADIAYWKSKNLENKEENEDGLIKKELKIPATIWKKIRELAATENVEYGYSLTKSDGTILTEEQFQKLLKKGEKSEMDANFITCETLTGHTHHSKNRNFNPPSPKDIDLLLTILIRCLSEIDEASDSQIIMSHCVFTHDKMYVFTLNPTLLLVKNNHIIGKDLKDALEKLVPLTDREKSVIDFKEYKDFLDQIYVTVTEHEYPTNETHDLNIKFFTLKKEVREILKKKRS